MRKITTKKLDMQMLTEFVLLTAVIVIVALLVFNINQDAQTDILLEDRTTTTIANQTLTTVTEAGETLDTSAYLNPTTCSVSACINSTDSVVIPVADWDDSTNCVVSYVTNSTANIFNNTDWKCTFTLNHAIATNRYNSTINSTEAVAKIPKSLKLLATAVVFGAVLFVILRVVPMGKKSELTQ